MKRYDLINALIQKNKYKKYLEIGVRDNKCFDKICVKDKSGVDPLQDEWENNRKDWKQSEQKVKYRMTSDEYFEKYDTKYDIIFIDGLHENEQVYRDIQNSLKCLNKGGTIIMHDCLPIKEEHQIVPRQSNYWNGDVWKAFVRTRNERKDVEMCVVDSDTGLGIIQFKELKEPAINEEVILDWDNYVCYKDEWMNIKSVDEIVSIIGAEHFPRKRHQAFLHSGCLGDVIWSLPFIISKKGGDLYLRDYNDVSATNQNFKGLFRLLQSQPYIRKVIKYPNDYGSKSINLQNGKIDLEKKVNYHPDIEFDFDLDYFRNSPHLNKEHLITSYFTSNKEQPTPLPLPYLIVKDDFDFKNENLNKRVSIPAHKYNVFQITGRYRVEYDWKKLIESQENKNYFIGLKEEYDEVVKDYEVKESLIFYGDKVTDMYDMALMIKNCDKFFCNPSVGHCLAVGMNKEYYLVKNPDQGGVQTNLPIENIVEV